MLLEICVAAATALHPMRTAANALHPTRVAAPRMDAAAWRASNVNELNMLPFGLEEALLPGETKQVHLYEARFLQLFEEAEAKHNSCVSQLLVTPGGNVAAVSSLLEIEESRKQDVGVWAKLRCIGRIRLAEVEPTDFGYVRAQVSLVTDKPPGDEDIEAALTECLEVHAGCRELQAKLSRRTNTDSEGGDTEGDAEGGDERSGLKALLDSLSDGGGADERVEWGHELREGSLGYDTALPRLRDARRQTLCLRGLDEAPANGLDERMQKLWGAADESEAEAQLLSFTAAACLSVRERAMALTETSTLERLQAATAAFRESQRRLAAQLALADATGGDTEV